MSKTKQIGAMLRDQTLDAVRNTQDAAVKVVTVWTDAANKIPGVAEVARQWPTQTAVIDSSFDFVQQLLDSQREFAGRLVAVTTPDVAKPKPVAAKAVTAKPKPVAAKAVTAKPKPVAAKKTAPTKKAAAAKKSSTARASGAANR